jgi:hypothetical protein
MAKQFRLNLLRKERLSIVTEATTFFKYYAKYIIILTQLVVLSVFFFKVVLDQSVIDLKETIDQKNQIILTAETMINSNNVMAKKLKDVETIVNKINADQTALTTTLSNIPDSVTIEQITLNEGTITVIGSTYEAIDINRLELRLRKRLNRDISLENVEKETNIYKFELVVPSSYSLK